MNATHSVSSSFDTSPSASITAWCYTIDSPAIAATTVVRSRFNAISSPAVIATPVQISHRHGSSPTASFPRCRNHHRRTQHSITTSQRCDSQFHPSIHAPRRGVDTHSMEHSSAAVRYSSVVEKNMKRSIPEMTWRPRPADMGLAGITQRGSFATVVGSSASDCR